MAVLTLAPIINFPTEAFIEGRYQKHRSERKSTFLKLAQLIEDNKTELAVLESLESGKPISESVSADLPETVGTIQ